MKEGAGSSSAADQQRAEHLECFSPQAAHERYAAAAESVSVRRLHESLARVHEEMQRDGVSGEEEVGAAGGVKRRNSRGGKRARGGTSGHCL